MFRILSRLFGGRRGVPTESDVPADRQQVTGKPTGGVPGDVTGDDTSTTGTSPNEGFVGRAAGDDAGYSETTGAEKRAE